MPRRGGQGRNGRRREPIWDSIPNFRLSRVRNAAYLTDLPKITAGRMGSVEDLAYESQDKTAVGLQSASFLKHDLPVYVGKHLDGWLRHFRRACGGEGA